MFPGKSLVIGPLRVDLDGQYCIHPMAAYSEVEPCMLTLAGVDHA
jgi:hypothetical protein